MIFPFGKVRHMGMMARVKPNKPVIPEISPGIQGSRAYQLLTDEQKGMLKFALADAAKYYNCQPFELRWGFGPKRSGVAPLKIWLPKKIKIGDLK